MKLISIRKVGFFGLGLIGGSIAKALIKACPGVEIIARARSKETIRAAFSDGIIANPAPLPVEDFKDCDIIFLCAPVDANIAYIRELKDIISERTILTDVGSVKGGIIRAAEEAGISASFMGGHPMAGLEKGGYEHSDPALLENAYYILTPGKGLDPAITEDFAELVKALTAVPIVMSESEHDFATAAVSHIPHIIASSLVRLVMENDGPEEHLRQIAAGGFRDITRIASSDPALWRTIFLENREEILNLLPRFRREIDCYEEALQQSDGETLQQLFADGKEYRDSIELRKKGALQSAYEFYIDLPDEAGAIATAATLLATNGISIRNIGIVHNREFEEGVLHIEFYDVKAMDRAEDLLSGHGYVIHRR